MQYKSSLAYFVLSAALNVTFIFTLYLCFTFYPFLKIEMSCFVLCYIL